MGNIIKQFIEFMKSPMIDNKDPKNSLEYEYGENQDVVVLNIGQKFYYINDNDPWYIVGFVQDSDYHTSILVVFKSWAKYKNRWTYKVEHIDQFIYCLHLVNQLKLKKKDNKIYVVPRKDK